MDGTVGLSCQPVEISGRNYMLRRAAAELIRHDPPGITENTIRAQRSTSTPRPATT
jgi:hypothetical protein